MVVEEGTANRTTTNDHHGAEVMVWYISGRQGGICGKTGNKS